MGCAKGCEENLKQDKGLTSDERCRQNSLLEQRLEFNQGQVGRHGGWVNGAGEGGEQEQTEAG